MLALNSWKAFLSILTPFASRAFCIDATCSNLRNCEILEQNLNIGTEILTAVRVHRTNLNVHENSYFALSVRTLASLTTSIESYIYEIMYWAELRWQ